MGSRFFSKVPHDTSADKNIVLTALASVYVQLRNSRPEIASFASQDEPPEDFHIQSHARLKYASGGSRFARVRSAEEQGGAFTEIPQPTTNADPGGNTRIGKDVQSGCGSHKEREST